MYLKRPVGGLAFCLFYLASCFTNKVRAGAEPPQPRRGRARRREMRGVLGLSSAAPEGAREVQGPWRSRRRRRRKGDGARCPLLAPPCPAQGESAGQPLPEEGCPTGVENPLAFQPEGPPPPVPGCHGS